MGVCWQTGPRQALQLWFLNFQTSFVRGAHILNDLICKLIKKTIISQCFLVSEKYIG